MILIYTPKISNRLQYAIKLVLQQICGFDYTVTTSGEEFLNFKGARINYSDKDFPFESINIIPSGFLMQKGIKEFWPEIGIRNSIPAIFPNPDNVNCDLGYDIFSAAFYLASRYEEYLPFLEDRYGRFEADQSLAYQNGFLEKPIIDIYAMELREKLLAKFPFTDNPAKDYSFIPTYDIDIAYAFKGKGLARNTLAIIKDLITLNFLNLKNRIEVLSGRKNDPFDTYQLQLDIQKKYGLKPIYFFLAAEYGPYDKNISIRSRCFDVLLKTLGDYAETGIHPSFASNRKEKRLAKEISVVSKTLNKPIENSRQHFLKLHLPDTYQKLIKNNIYRDYTMGFASHVGFRAGTCTPFTFYDLATESETRMTIFPFAIMDGTLKDYMKLNKEDALKKINTIIDEIKDVNGTFISLWHNESLCDCQRWSGWRDLYIQMVEYAL